MANCGNDERGQEKFAKTMVDGKTAASWDAWDGAQLVSGLGDCCPAGNPSECTVKNQENCCVITNSYKQEYMIISSTGWVGNAAFVCPPDASL